MPLSLGTHVNVTPACGGDLSHATFTGLSPAQFQDLSGKEPAIAKKILEAEIAEKLGVKRTPLAMLIEGRIENVKDQLSTIKVGRQSITLPYIQRPQQEVINVELFQIEAGQANPGAGSNGVHAGAWDLTVILPKGKFQTALTEIDKYFKPGMTVVVHNWDDNISKTAQHIQFKIIASANADDGDTPKATVTVEPQITSTAYTGLEPGDEAPYQPTAGVVNLSHNSINDYESWCETLPASLKKGIRISWLQTSRYSFCTDEIYEETLRKIFNGELNDYDAAFKYMTVAEQNKIREALDQQMRVNSYFWGQPISEKQTPETYAQLELIKTFEEDETPVAYKANACGLYHILVEEGRTHDFNGDVLNLNTVVDFCYDIYRTRKSVGEKPKAIDLMTDRETAARIMYAFKKAFERDWEIGLQTNLELGKTLKFEELFELEYNTYKLPNQSFKLNVFSCEEMDDWVNEFSETDFPSVGHTLWAIDWTDVRKGVVEVNSVVRKTPSPDTAAEYKCVMKANIRTYDMRSETWTILLDNPGRHMLFHNFSAAVPELSLLPYTSS